MKLWSKTSQAYHTSSSSKYSLLIKCKWSATNLGSCWKTRTQHLLDLRLSQISFNFNLTWNASTFPSVPKLFPVGIALSCLISKGKSDQRLFRWVRNPVLGILNSESPACFRLLPISTQSRPRIEFVRSITPWSLEYPFIDMGDKHLAKSPDYPAPPWSPSGLPHWLCIQKQYELLSPRRLYLERGYWRKSCLFKLRWPLSHNSVLAKDICSTIP